MSTATELLRRALQLLERHFVKHPLTHDIRTFLATEPEAEPGNGWHLREVYFEDGEPMMHREPLKPAEPEAEPVSEEIGKALIEMHTNYVATPKVVYQIELNEKAMNADLVAALRFSISKYFDDAYVYGDELLAEVLEDIKNHLPRPEPARKPMTEEEAIELCPFTREEFKAGFLTGIRFAEKHHGITE